MTSMRILTFDCFNWGIEAGEMWGKRKYLYLLRCRLSSESESKINEDSSSDDNA